MNVKLRFGNKIHRSKHVMHPYAYTGNFTFCGHYCNAAYGDYATSKKATCRNCIKSKGKLAALKHRLGAVP